MANDRVATARIEFLADDKKYQESLKRIQQSAKDTGAPFKQLERDINQAFGVTLERNARSATQAIQAVGGAAKLTDAEAQKHLRTLDEYIAKTKRLGKEAPADILQARDALKRVNDESNKSPRLFDTMSAKATALGAAFGTFIGNVAWSAVNKLGSELSKFASQGAQLPALESSFRRLSRGVGEDADAMLKSLQKGTQGMVTNFDLMQSANKAMLLGLPVTTESMGTMAEAATKLGRAMGQDATKSLDDLITALGRSSPMILDNLGLTVKVGEANEAYAAKLGKSVEALTDAEKKMAFYEAAMEAARRKVDELGEQTLTLAEIATAAWAKVGNAVTSAAATINTGIGRILSRQGEWKLFLQDILSGGSGVGGAVAGAALREQIEQAAAAGRRGKDTTLPSELSPEEEMRRLLEAAKQLTEQGLKPLTAEQQRAALAWLDGKKSAKEVADELNKYKVTAGVTEAQIQRLIDQRKSATKATDEHANALKRIAEAQIPLTEAQQKQIADLLKLGIGHNDIARALNVSEIAVKNYAAELKTLNAIIGEQIALLPRLKNARVDVNFGLDPFASGPLAFQIPTLPPSFRSSSLGGDLAGRLDSIFSGIDQSGIAARAAIAAARSGKGPETTQSGFFQAAFGSSQQFGGQLASSIVGAIQGGGNPLVAAGSSIGTSLMSGLAKTLTDGTGIAIKGALGGAINAILPGVGSLLGPLVGKIGSAFAGLFDRNKGRDLVKQFAESMGGFDALQKKLEGLGAEGQRLWVQLTQGVGRNNPQQAQAAIDAITEALERSERRTAELNTSIGGMLERIRSLGGTLSEPLQKYLRELERGGKLTQENIALLEQLSGSGEVDLQILSDAVSRYGGNIEELGGTFQNARLHELWQQVIDDLDLFERAGISGGDAMNLAKDKVIELAQQSQKFGVEIPANMKPFLQSLIDSGELLDANGEKITDINQLTFGETLQTTLQKLNETLQQLIETFNQVPGAIAQIPRRVDIDVNVRERRGVESDLAPDEVSFANRGGLVTRRGVQYRAFGGPIFQPFGTDTVPAMLTPGEFVLNRSAVDLVGADTLAALNAGRLPPGVANGGGMVQNIIVKLEERTLMRATRRGLPRDLVMSGAW